MFLCLPFFLLADSEPKSKMQYTPVEITKSLYFLKGGKGGNIVALVGKDGLLLVDDDYKEMTPALERAIRALGYEKDVDYIINTHWHGDHTGGNLGLGKNAIVVAHDNVRHRLSHVNQIKLLDSYIEAYPEVALPDITYSKTLALHFNGEDVNLMHYANSHTDGDSVVFFNKANVVHMGDMYFNGIFPFVDTESGGNVITLANNIESLLQIISADAVIVPGHGAISNKTELSAFLTMLRGTVAEVKAMKVKGLSLQSMQSQGLSKKWEKWGHGFLPEKLWISIIVSSL